MQVVHDLAADVDGRAEALEGALDGLDGALDAGAERSRRGQDARRARRRRAPSARARPRTARSDPERAGSAEDRPAVGRVRDGTDHRQRVVHEAAHDPGRLHVDRHSAGRGQIGTLAAAHVARRRHERAPGGPRGRPAGTQPRRAAPRRAAPATWSSRCSRSSLATTRSPGAAPERGRRPHRPAPPRSSRRAARQARRRRAWPDPGPRR